MYTMVGLSRGKRRAPPPKLELRAPEENGDAREVEERQFVTPTFTPSTTPSQTTTLLSRPRPSTPRRTPVVTLVPLTPTVTTSPTTPLARLLTPTSSSTSTKIQTPTAFITTVSIATVTVTPDATLAAPSVTTIETTGVASVSTGQDVGLSAVPDAGSGQPPTNIVSRQGAVLLIVLGALGEIPHCRFPRNPELN